MLYAWILMIKKGEIKQEVLMSKDIDLKKCKEVVKNEGRKQCKT